KNTIKNSDFDCTPTFSRKNQSPGSKIFDKTKKIQSLKPPFPCSNSSSIKENSPMISANLDHGSCSSINMMEHKENFIYNTNNEEVTDEKHRLFVYHQSFLSVFMKFIGTRKLFCQYEYDKAIAGILSLPYKLLDVSEIRYNLFIYYFEHHKLDKAISIMNKILEKDSSWLKGIDKFSTALHAKNEYNMLLHLSDKMRTKNYLNKQTWVVTGNLFSLMKMPDEVIKCFKRATKIDMNYSYGFFLLGYEYLMNKDYENAISMYQSCIKINPMNYKYWNASGQCSREKGNFEDAKYCFSRAIHLNSKSPSILTNLASIHLDLNEYNTAEILLNKALEIDPINLTAKFILAKTLSYLQKYNESNEILLKLKDHKPEEAILYTLLYINYKEQQKEIDAQQNYNLAKKYGPFILSKMLYEWSKNSKIAQSKNSVLNKSLNLDCDIQASFLVANSSSYCP
ncbi:MAG: anaphase-promoting complex subunit cdc27, partial [Paramarteilia canceri]